MVLGKNGFNKWSGTYDQSIAAESAGYPFEGYYELLSYMQRRILVNKPEIILDVGVGTGLLSEELYKKGIQIYGIDFSKKMLEEAKLKMPDGMFFLYGFSCGLPSKLEALSFDCIISSYALHHLTNTGKISFIHAMNKHLTSG